MFYHNLGGLEHARGRYARGEPFARRSVAIRERALGADHPDVARDVAALGGILDGLERYAEAAALHRRALAIFEPRRGRRDQLEIAYTLENLAACCHAQGRSAEAEPLATRSVALKEKLLGATHPDLGVGLSNLAVIQNALGRASEAEALCRRALAILEQGLGAAHPTTAICREFYASLRPQSAGA
jgi:tetratricopeptide (TPR) repeat protein